MELELINLETGEILSEFSSESKLIDGLGHPLDKRDFEYLLQEIEIEEQEIFLKQLVHFEKLQPEETLTFIDSYLRTKLFVLSKINNPQKTQTQFESVCKELGIQKK